MLPWANRDDAKRAERLADDREALREIDPGSAEESDITVPTTTYDPTKTSNDAMAGCPRDTLRVLDAATNMGKDTLDVDAGLWFSDNHWLNRGADLAGEESQQKSGFPGSARSTSSRC